MYFSISAVGHFCMTSKQKKTTSTEGTVQVGYRRSSSSNIKAHVILVFEVK